MSSSGSTGGGATHDAKWFMTFQDKDLCEGSHEKSGGFAYDRPICCSAILRLCSQESSEYSDVEMALGPDLGLSAGVPTSNGLQTFFSPTNWSHPLTSGDTTTGSACQIQWLGQGSSSGRDVRR